MTPEDRLPISRRALITGIAAGAGTLILQPVAAFAASPTDTADINVGEIAAYLKVASATGFTDLAGIHAEYQDAVAKFPFALPRGWAFPAESDLRDSEPGVEWERGNGVAEVYFYWQSALAAAAYDAHQRGDKPGVDRLLDQLESGFNSDVRRAVLEDPLDGFVRIPLASARRGEFAKLMEVSNASR